MPNYPPSPAPLSDRDTYTTWPGGVDPTARVYAGGKRRRATRRSSTRKSRKNTRKSRSTRRNRRVNTRRARRSTRRVSSRRVFQYVM